MTPIEKIPVELLERVLSLIDCSHNARLTYRLVCRGFRSVLNPLAFRRIRTSGFNRDSFDHLVDISQSPLAQFVVEYEYKLTPFLSASTCRYSFISFFIDYFPSLFFLRINANRAKEDIHDVDSLVQLSSNYDSPLAVQDMAKALVHHHKTHLHQVDILGTFYDIISLSKALPAFKNLKFITISRFDASGYAPPDFESATTRAFWAVIKALNSCPFSVESFTIDSLYHSTLIGIPMHKLGQIHEVLENLKQFSVLSLCVRTGLSERVRTILEEEMISQTPNLEVLRIGNAEMRSGPPHTSQFPLRLGGSLNATLFYWPHLKVLEMRSKVSILENRLVLFLGRHGPTLRELKISGCSLSADNQQISDWRGVFQNLRILLTLDKLLLSELRIENKCAGETKFLDVEEAQLREWEKWVPRIGNR